MSTDIADSNKVIPDNVSKAGSPFNGESDYLLKGKVGPALDNVRIDGICIRQEWWTILERFGRMRAREAPISFLCFITRFSTCFLQLC